MSNARATRLTRRGILAAGGALGLGAVLAACGDDDTNGGGSGKETGAAQSGPWSFEDDRGQTAKADKVPSNIVAFVGVAAALHDYGVQVKGVFGPTRTKDGKPDVQAGDMDITKVTSLGNEWGQFNIEKYASLAPDLLVTTTFDDAGTLWYVPEESKDKITAVGAPSVAVSVYDRQLTQPLQRMLELARTLGADVTSKKITDAKKRFEDASARLRAAAKAKPDIKVMAGSASQDLFYVSGTNLSVDLEYFKALGVNFIEPPEKAKAEGGGWFESLSWENVDKYGADIIMMDDRSSAIQPADIGEGTWKKLPAVKAGQVISRSPEPILSYDKCVPMVENLAKAIENAKKVS
ncbi:ABC transporter substrate-binding protein [Streptomyces cyaneogriseus subsp. noncyanogenus]|uniref:ABC transporter substrate-binding protein n=1 Tax=Streptomyces cyaneogriseus subsp. noncyanogenus TaxID=477245 RepID=A0A0C5GD17_9ACTN|nr:ABC transporter substrate-binding protein [Streptomyces cyaneogriseus]AJP02131.1 ABC transporter substrate-binding protein [Streptomyces cyaneogriseus subsp. noncyanogenus]